MTLRIALSSVFVVALAGLLAGCGNPEPKRFVDGDLTNQLHPQAVEKVRETTERYFGKPQNLVAPLEFADDKGKPVIDFGRIEGEVTASGAEGDYQLQVALTGDPSVSPADLEGLGLVWTSGSYRSAVEVPRKKGETATRPALFHATGFAPGDEGGGILSINYKLEEPPKQGDKFTLVGHRLRRGRSLYMQHCMHCHGYSGDGNGPTAKYLNPKPRDYRLGVFKFTSTGKGKKARRADLVRIVKQGIPGTYMPSFLLLDDGELADIIEYVRWLAIRGEFERRIVISLATANNRAFTKEGWTQAQKSDSKPAEALTKFMESQMPQRVDRAIGLIAGTWAEAETGDTVVRPRSPRTPPTRESIQRGRALFISKKADCKSCHGATGEGNGDSTALYWPDTRPLAPAKFFPEPGFFDDWGNKLQPRNLTTGIFRGGRRPIDIYRRIFVGIKGTPMPEGSKLTDAEIWDLVNYVLHIPHLENGTYKSPDESTAAEKTAAKRNARDARVGMKDER